MDLTFDKKKTYKDENGDEIINLADSVVNSEAIPITTNLVLNSSHNARIDKVVFDNIGLAQDAIDSLMYVNHIVNPFSVQEGDLIFICDHNENYYKKNDDIVFPDIKDSNNDVEKFISKTDSATDKLKSKSDSNRKERLQRLAMNRKNGVSQVVPTNILKDSKESMIIQNGKIILGTTINTK